MTEPNDPTPPLSRMRFSWQRGTPQREGDTAPPAAESDAAYEQDSPAAIDEQGAYQQPWYEQPSNDQQVQYAQQSVQPSRQPPVSQPAQPATRLGRAADPPQSSTATTGGTAGHHPTTQEPVHGEATADSIVGQRFDLDNEGRRWSLRARQAARSRDAGAGSAGAGSPGTADTRHARARTGDRARDREHGDGGDQRGRGGSRGKSGRERAAGSSSFEVPKPGGRFSGGRGNHVGIRVILLLTACLLVLGITGYAAYTYGIASVRDDDYALSQQDIDRFGLTEFPREQAGRFASDYARLCMTHSTKEGSEERRQEQLAEYVSSGVKPGCGWSGAADQEVVDATWTGDSEPITVDGLEKHARMMTVRVLTADERSQMVTVPVYVSDLRSGQGMRVIGDIGEMPQTLLVAPPETDSTGQVDQQLTEALVNDQFFQQFFEAWGSSDEPSINRFVTPKATDRARAGLADSLQQPRISDAEVFLPADADDEHSWSQGDRTDAYVWVTWQNPAVDKQVRVTRAYRLQLVMTEQAPNVAQGWAVHDIRGGVPSVETN